MQGGTAPSGVGGWSEAEGPKDNTAYDDPINPINPINSIDPVGHEKKEDDQPIIPFKHRLPESYRLPWRQSTNA